MSWLEQAKGFIQQEEAERERLRAELDATNRRLQSEGKLREENFKKMIPVIPQLLQIVRRELFDEQGQIRDWHRTTTGPHTHTISDGYDSDTHYSHKTKQNESVLVVPKLGKLVVYYPIEETVGDYHNSQGEIRWERPTSVKGVDFGIGVVRAGSISHPGFDAKGELICGGAGTSLNSPIYEHFLENVQYEIARYSSFLKTGNLYSQQLPHRKRD